MKWLIKNILLVAIVFLILMRVEAMSFFTSPTLSFAHISDIHLSNRNVNTSYRLISNSRDLLDDEINQINATPNLDFVMLTGDGIDRPQEVLAYELMDKLNTLKYPWYIAFGNHDICVGGNFSKKRYLSIIRDNNTNFTFDKSYYSFKPKKGFLVIVLDAVVDNRITSNGEIPQEELAWLKDTINNSGNDTVLIFAHHPVYEPLKSPSHKITNSDELYAILKNAKKPVAYFSGHYHTTKITKDENVLNVSTPALISYPNAFRIIKVTNKKDKIVFDLKFRETHQKDLQKKAKLLTFSQALYYGGNNDREAIIEMDK